MKPTTHPLIGFFDGLGKNVLELVQIAGGMAILTKDIVRYTFKRPFYFPLLIEQVFSIGVKSFLLVAITGLATGSVMALQFGHGLTKFGGTLYVPKVVALAILKEMGPVFTSLLVAGRVGSGITSEVASMNVTQQIDAIRSLGTNPIKRIVIPRVFACMIALPILTVFADFIGLFGAAMVCYFDLNIGIEYFLSKVLQTLLVMDLLTGMMKTVVFAFFISVCACYKGLNTQGGTQGVGNSTTWVVVASSIFIMVSDFFLTKLFILTVYAKYK
jgi:phospholipid/cholesterol/gamma-HCH transport system permease protein